LEKGAQVGSHILSGAVFNPRAMNELIPDWKTLAPPLNALVTEDRFTLLTSCLSMPLLVPPAMRNHGHHLISLELLCRFLSDYAQALGIDIFPGFPAAELLFEHDTVIGVITQDRGRDKQGQPTPQYQPGIALHAKQVLIAEGARGSLARTLIDHYQLDSDSSPQTYALGVKEIWEVDSATYRPGKVEHTIGWPLSHDTYGGSFVYHLNDHQVAVGMVVGLDYTNPTLSPFEELQRFKTHPYIKPLLQGGTRIAYGARALTEGGYQSIPKLTFPGGLLIGCAAGFMDVPQIKGIHTAMKSGMLAAESTFATIHQQKNDFDTTLRASWVGTTLYQARNIRPGFQKGLYLGLANAAFETYITRGHSPWTLRNHADHKTLKPLRECTPIQYPKPDNILTFDRLTSLKLTAVSADEHQPSSLVLTDPSKAITVNYQVYGSPEQYYCPAQVYEIVGDDQKRLQINFTNCIHCKTCDIKDPTQNIVWHTPEGGDGPHYTDM
jgi:electron-transferring-flavoprotein dehydrogenase